MYDNLAYTGGGDNTYNDVVPTGNGTGLLQEVTTSASWGGTATRLWANNSNAGLTLGSGTACTASPTGTGVMTSVCGDQVLYNFCAALGLDTGTTPTCAAVSNTTTGPGMSSTGTVGATGSGVGGESKGNTGAAAGSICPTGWRIPRGTDNSSGSAVNTNNEWAILNGSFLNNTLSAADTTSTDASRAPWQPAGTAATFPQWNGAFGAVAAGYVSDTTGVLNDQSTNANWWTSSLASATNAYRVGVSITLVLPGAYGSGKALGFSVRCVFP
ncbi:hypothetical protein FWH13_03430 [Candidatus Saccharibacteria bacterium]|nr:hypothetical protein [Candidatus Saccharibacteria bacterium]